jgi:hypothetical protein
MPLPSRYAKASKDARARKLRTLLKQKLAAAEPRLVAKFKKLASAKFPAEASELGIELELASTYEFDPIVWCICDDGMQLGFRSKKNGAPAWKPPVPLNESLIKPVKVATPAILKAARITDDDGWDYCSIIETECLKFTRACWLKAGGKTCKVHAIAQEHDSGVCLELKTGKWRKT